eukprot:358513-Chlamydomonas_euryale.AAC.9
MQQSMDARSGLKGGAAVLACLLACMLQFEKVENKPVAVAYVAAAVGALFFTEWLIHLPALDIVSPTPGAQDGAMERQQRAAGADAILSSSQPRAGIYADDSLRLSCPPPSPHPDVHEAHDSPTATGTATIVWLVVVVFVFCV